QWVVAEIKGASGWQQSAGTEMVVNKQAGAQLPGGAESLVMRQDEAERPDKVGGHAPQNFALRQGPVHHAEGVAIEVAQAAVDELGCGRRGAACQVAHLGEEH